ncbi:MAG: Bax inhibitor-1/YccA family protein [Dongiaceae bacterium]
MATRPEGRTAFAGRADIAQIDVGLRQYMLRVYNYMAGGLALTGLLAYFTASSPAMLQLIFGSPLRYVVIFAPFALVLFMGFRIHKMSLGAAQLTYWAYAALNGLAFASIFLVYTHTSIARVFFITAGTFAAMSLYGYTTRRDLTGFGNFLMMGLIGIVIAALVNIFLASSALAFAISVIGVIVFVGLTAYDTQKIKEWYVAADDGATMGKKAVYGALTLYLDFINLFLLLLRLFGNSRN